MLACANARAAASSAAASTPTTHPGLEVRAGFSEEDLLKSQRSAEIGSARELAEEWRRAVIAKGCTIYRRPMVNRMDDSTEHRSAGNDALSDGLHAWRNVWCEHCNAVRPLRLEHIEPDDHNRYGSLDVLCAECAFIVATFHGGEPEKLGRTRSRTPDAPHRSRP